MVSKAERERMSRVKAHTELDRVRSEQEVVNAPKKSNEVGVQQMLAASIIVIISLLSFSFLASLVSSLFVLRSFFVRVTYSTNPKWSTFPLPRRPPPRAARCCRARPRSTRRSRPLPDCSEPVRMTLMSLLEFARLTLNRYRGYL